MQYFDITVAPNKTQDVCAPGRYIRYYAGTATGGGDPTIIVKAGSMGTAILLAPGQSLRLPPGVKLQDTWHIANLANTGTITGTLVIGDGEIVDNRINGSVSISSVTDVRRNRTTLTKNAFLATTSRSGGGVNAPTAQLWNPPASGKTLYLESVEVGSLAGNYDLFAGYGSAALATLGGEQPYSKLMGDAAASVGRVYNEATGNYPTRIQWRGVAATAAPWRREFGGTLVIPPGAGFTVMLNNINAALSVGFEYYEE